MALVALENDLGNVCAGERLHDAGQVSGARFPTEPWAHTTYTSPAASTAGEFATATDMLIPVNAAHLPAAARSPVVWLDSDATPAHTIFTDFFAFDDAADRYGLRAYEPAARRWSWMMPRLAWPPPT